MLLIGGAIYGTSHVRDYTTSWILADITGERPRAQGLAVGVPLSLLNTLLQLSHCAMQTFPLSQKDEFSFLAALLLFFGVNSKGGSS